MKTRNVKGLIFNVAFVFVPSLTFMWIIILNSDMQIYDILNKLGINLNSPYGAYIPFFILSIFLITITVLLFVFLVKYTANNLTRFVFTILSALTFVSSVITLTPNNPCVASPIIMFYFLPLCFVYLLCVLSLLILYLLIKFRPAKHQGCGKLEQDIS